MLTITTQGSFVSNGSSQLINIPEGANWMKVVNWSNIVANTAASAFEFEWYQGMPINDGIASGFVVGTPAATYGMLNCRSIDVIGQTVGGFTLFDTTTQTPSATIAVTDTTAANAPVVTVASTNGIVSNQTIVRLSNISEVPNICGIDFTVTVDSATTFTLPAFANVTGGGTFPAGLAGYCRIISVVPFPEFYPANRTVINITQAMNPQVTTSVVHGLTVGQNVRMHVPAVCGMIQMDNLEGTVVGVLDAYNFIIGNAEQDSVDSTGFNPFTWPSVINYPYEIPQVVPVGEVATNIVPVPFIWPYPTSHSYHDATNNIGFRGMLLASGSNGDADLLSPAGAIGNIMYWQAGHVENM